MKSINEMRKSLECTGNRADHMKERISEIENQNLEMFQAEEEREQRFFLKSEETLLELSDSTEKPT